MNKRIVELHNQTMRWVADNRGLRISDRLPSGYAEKFAELIVKDCVEQLNISNVPAPISAGLNLGRVAIKEHFGVKYD